MDRNILGKCFLWAFVACVSTATCRGDTISDFALVNPLFFAYTGTTWATPVRQFQSFTAGSVTGQEVLALSGGNPTVRGGAGRAGMQLDLTGTRQLDLTARWRPGNAASAIQVLLFDNDGTILRFNFAGTQFNSSTFATATANVSDAVTRAAGTVPGFNWSYVTTYEVQGNYSDPGGAGTAAFRAQFDQLTATAVPEPGSGTMAGAGALCVLLAFGLRKWVLRSRIG